MNWDALGDQDDDDDRFFETRDRLSSAVPLDLASSGSDDEDEFEDTRLSFASAISSVSTTEFRNYAVAAAAAMSPDYDIWMAAPGSINERRKRLFQGMGLSDDKEVLRISSKEFIVNEYNQDGMWNKVSDLQTGKQLTMEEFEKCVGHSRIVKELMSRENVSRMNGDDRKITANNYLSKSLRMSKRRGAAILKNIKGVAHSMSITGRGADKERDINNSPTAESKQGGKNSSSSGWIKVKQTGKSYKELSALNLCQEIQAHEGSIWTMKESDPLHPFSTPGLGEVTPMPSERKKKKKGSSSKKSSPIPEYVHVSETVFSLSEKPICSFSGHLDDVLDLSWSRSQLLLSSSMDKTVRLWDMETKSCLKLFAHNDYVTCIHFNPMDDNYFISGSLDNKVRIWNIPDRQLVDWTDLHEMVTAVCYTPDGQGAFIGSHKGSCRMYNVEDCKLSQAEQIDLQNKKNPKKITGFQFSPGNPSEVLVASADSRIRILDGSELVHKFRGFRNLNSQIAASFSKDGKYVICASEDSNVYVWKRDERSGTGKGKNMIDTRSHESFQCRDVSIAIPWPGTVKGDPPPCQLIPKGTPSVPPIHKHIQPVVRQPKMMHL
ncbi:hypothetical protein GH714_013952 [Hevea brasiliensis]|uniref:Uncharacterized protein n=1 Tax=Hevea brasiliensis TaxID=3981 RepID=A0A6A6LU31_HEVBR|nr:hypothetical protein GH714_013952 [Hevea brasiliensis]